MEICFRVKAKTGLEAWRIVTVSGEGDVIHCDCAGFDGLICSHIDAVLVAGERAMVASDDLEAADKAAMLTAGKIVLPETWRGSWRRKLDWRGISHVERRKRSYVRDSSKPLVCFTGNCGRPRTDLTSEAKANGWEVVNRPSAHLDVLVAADPTGKSAKLQVARTHAIPIVDIEIWASLMLDGEIPT